MPVDTPPESTTATGGGIDPATLEQILGAFGSGAEAQVAAAQIGAEALLGNTQLQQQFIREGKTEAQDIYGRMSGAGWHWLNKYGDMLRQGAPKYSWDQEFNYPEWQWNQQFQFQGLPDYLKGRFTEEGLRSSPNYGLYQFAQGQQSDAINKQLRAAGLMSSGAGLKKDLAASTGLTQQFISDEYNRALGEYGTEYDQALSKYMMDYEQALQGHNIGYEEAKQKYGISYDQYVKQFGAEYGAYEDALSRYMGIGQYAWLADQARANAAFGAGSQMGAGALQTGQALAGLQSNLGSGLASTYNAQGNTLAGLYNAAQNRALTQSSLNQAQSNWNTANNWNQVLGLANLGSGLARTAYDAYRYYNTPATTSTYNTPTFNNPNYGYSYGATTPYDYNFVSYA